MTWDVTKYCKFPDQPTMDSVAKALGLTINSDGTYNHTATIAMTPCPTPWITIPVFDTSTKPPTVVTPGVADTGVWAVVRFQVGANPLTIAPAVPYLATPTNVPTKWSGDA